MSFTLSNPLGRFRLIAILEGISYLLLLGIAMPLKYMADMPQPVLYTGWVHGVLFMLYIVALIQVWIADSWPFRKAFLAGIASVLPFGTFIFDRQLRNDPAVKTSQK